MSRSGPEILVLPSEPEPPPDVLKVTDRLAARGHFCESTLGLPVVLWRDERSGAFYTVCHITGKTIADLADLEAVVDPNESEEYKLNRELYLDNYAYRLMEADAKRGRSFEDIVVEFDESYRPRMPLKVFGGQHRIQAIREAADEMLDRPHGVRVYFGLTVEQRVDIATVNNTSIAISNDLLDRMQEELFGSELRDWAQRVGLLEFGVGFADRRDSKGRPTVRIARTLLVNYYAGLEHQNVMPQPYVCRSGPQTDERYEALRPKIKWDDKSLAEAGTQFARLHQAQRSAVLGRDTDSYLEFANKCVHPCVVAAWAYVTGMLQRNQLALANHYALADVTKGDPLNAGALLKAHLKGVDPDTYRGLGARISANELGRMVQVFYLQAVEASKRGVNLNLANAAIKTYEAIRATEDAKKATKGI